MHTHPPYHPNQSPPSMHGHALMWPRSPAASEGMRMQTNTSLRHGEIGAVSLSLNGDEVAISLGRALPLDMTHQV